MKILAALVFSLCALAVSASAQVVPTATLSWVAPTAYTDGTAIPAGTVITYNVYQGTSASTLAQVATGVTALTDVISTGLTVGKTYFFAVTAVTGGLEGPQSNVGSKAFEVATVTLTVK